MLFAVPDAVTTAGGAEGNVNPGISCPPPHAPTENGISTSCGNQFYDNVLGKPPPGFKFPAALDQFGADHSSGPGPYPNGTDFWWDEFLNNTANCWYRNTGPDGTAGSVTGPDAPSGPGAGSPPPGELPSDCSTSLGEGDGAKEAYLLECSNGPDDDTGPTDCDWWRPAPQPTSDAADREAAERKRAFSEFAQTQQARDLVDRMKDLAGLEGRP
jgi:hypothetical protein